ncbi:hypothetical protein ACQKO5_12550 [Novosphingobium subterraneum]|uniref:hypothetical protein n=1 Tax=Novosphingobium subterraneum TaxID=48936 RepID=UPI003CFF8A8C
MEDDVYYFSLEEDEAGLWHISCRPEFHRHRELRQATGPAYDRGCTGAIDAIFSRRNGEGRHPISDP